MSFCSRSESSASLLSVGDQVINDSQKLFAFPRPFGSRRAMAESPIIRRHRLHSTWSRIDPQKGFLWTFSCPLSQVFLFRRVTLDAWFASVQFAGICKGDLQNA